MREPRAARATGLAGAALVAVATVLELLQIARPFGFPFWAWLGATIVGLGLLWWGLNAVRQDLGARVVAAILAFVTVLMIVVPFGFVVVLGAFQRRADLLTGPHVVPPAPTTIAFDQLMRIAYFEDGLRNSLVVSTTAAIVTTLLGLLGAYAIARLRFPARNATYTAVMIAYMLPGVALLVPLVAIFKGLGLIDTMPGMAIGHIALTVPLVTWILIGTFDGVEPDLEHAARIDGASRLQALRRVVLPVTVPSIVTAAVFAFVLSWNDLLVSKVLYVGSTPMLAPAIVNLMDPINRIEPQLSMAGLIASVPVLTLALVMQRYLIRGLGEGAVK
ncbi:MAG TPA: carbohydrate ABC transporter permease [Candidatus Limnocylindrales bacterium]|jgi:multiple sugar transport system permease protein